jgi:glycosyltransferase involved in cell wall biosynthesis
VSAPPGRRRRVNVFVPTLARHDAVSDQARHQVDLLRRWGHDPVLVSETWDAASAGAMVPLARALAADPPAAWVVHYSIWSEGLPRIRAAPGRKAFVYHNVTPPELLPRGPVAELCLRARRALVGLSDGWDLVLADSSYNAAELRRAGFKNPAVVPLLIPVRETAPPSGPRGDGVLFVGRVAPSKGLDDLIKAFALLRRLHRPGATLDVIGSAEGWERHAAGLEALAERIGCGGIAFRGLVPDQARDAAYASCGVLCVMSRHEGFCVPIVEAMRAGAPVVAFNAGAVAETMGGGGVLLPSPDPRLAAEAIAEVLSNPGLRERLRAGAALALAGVAPDVVEGRLHQTLGAIVDVSHPT